MSMLRARGIFASCLAVAIALLAGCSKQGKPPAPADTATSGGFELVADETLRPAIDSLVQGFNKQTPEAKVTVRYTSAALALDALIQNKARLVIIGRPLTDRERHLFDSTKIDLPEFDIALNGIAAIVAKDNPRRAISEDSIGMLVEGKWDARYYSTSYLGSTEAALDSIFRLKSPTLSGRIRRFGTTDSVIDAVRHDPMAIGFIGSSWLNKHTNASDSTVVGLRISSAASPEPLQLHLAYMYQGVYPLVSRVCGYTFEQPNTLPRGFLAYAMTSDGQRVFLNHDVLPRTQLIRIQPPR